MGFGSYFYKHSVYCFVEVTDFLRIIHFMEFTKVKKTCILLVYGYRISADIK